MWPLLPSGPKTEPQTSRLCFGARDRAPLAPSGGSQGLAQGAATNTGSIGPEGHRAGQPGTLKLCLRGHRWAAPGSPGLPRFLPPLNSAGSAEAGPGGLDPRPVCRKQEPFPAWKQLRLPSPAAGHVQLLSPHPLRPLRPPTAASLVTGSLPRRPRPRHWREIRAPPWGGPACASRHPGDPKQLHGRSWGRAA